MCDVLKELYFKVFNEDFKFDKDHRIRLQKVVYILENLGVHIGEYGFVWADRGPYSIALDYDAQRCALNPQMTEVRFSNWAEEGIDTVKTILSASVKYGKTAWLECVASMHYLKYVLRCKDGDSGVLRELEQLKPSLNNKDDNESALKWADRIEENLWETDNG